MEEQINRQIYIAVALLGGQSDILSIIGSYGSTLPNEEVLAMLKEWNEQTFNEKKNNIKTFAKYLKKKRGQ